MLERFLKPQLMNLPLFSGLLILGLFCSRQAYSQPNLNYFYHAPETANGKTIVIPVGTTFEGRIQSTIGSSISHPGERFTISLSSPVLANGNQVLLATGSEILGEVVEAIAAGKVPHDSADPKPIGKLRIQLTALRTPEGITYPLVASLIPDSKTDSHNGPNTTKLGSGMAYIGSQSSFEAVAPGRNNAHMRGRSNSPVLTQEDLMHDPIYGQQRNNYFSYNNQGSIRSLVKKHRNLFIYSGSPLSMRLDAPFKLAFSAAPVSNPLPSDLPATNMSPPHASSPHPPAEKVNSSPPSQESNF